MECDVTEFSIINFAIINQFSILKFYNLELGFL